MTKDMNKNIVPPVELRHIADLDSTPKYVTANTMMEGRNVFHFVL